MPICDCGNEFETEGQLATHIEVAHLIPLEKEQLDLSHRVDLLLVQIVDQVGDIAMAHERISPMYRHRHVR